MGGSTSVDIVSHEKVVGFWYFASDFEEFHEIVELTVYISADDDGGSDGDDIGLFCEYLFGLSVCVCTFSQRLLISASGRGLQVSISAICRSRLEWSVGVLVAIVYLNSAIINSSICVRYVWDGLVG